MAGKEVVDAGMGVEAENRKPDAQRMNVWSERHMHRQVPPTPEEMILTITNRWKSKPFNRRSGVTLVVQTAFVCGHWKWCCVGNFDGFFISLTRTGLHIDISCFSICGHNFEGRVQKTCSEHPMDTYLLDAPRCPRSSCRVYAKDLLEYPLPKNYVPVKINSKLV